MFLISISSLFLESDKRSFQSWRNKIVKTFLVQNGEFFFFFGSSFISTIPRPLSLLRSLLIISLQFLGSSSCEHSIHNRYSLRSSFSSDFFFPISDFIRVQLRFQFRVLWGFNGIWEELAQWILCFVCSSRTSILHFCIYWTLVLGFLQHIYSFFFKTWMHYIRGNRKATLT